MIEPKYITVYIFHFCLSKPINLYKDLTSKYIKQNESLLNLFNFLADLPSGDLLFKFFFYYLQKFVE